MLAHIPVHLVNQEQHGEIKRQILVAKSGDAVETFRVAPSEMDRHHIALIFYTLRDKRLLPRQVVDGSILALAAVQACRKHQHVVVTLEARLHHPWEIATLATRLVDADTYRFQTRQVEQKIIHQIAELAIIVLADDGTETYTVLSAQRMIGNKGIEFAVVLVRQVFQAYDFNIHLQIAHTFGEPFSTRKATALPQEPVHLVLVNNLLEPGNQEARYEFHLASHLALKNLIYVYRFLY